MFNYLKLIIICCLFLRITGSVYAQKVDFFAGLSHSSPFTFREIVSNGLESYSIKSSVCPTLGAIFYEWKRKKPHRKTGQYVSSSVASFELYQCKGDYNYSYYSHSTDYWESIYLNKLMLAIHYYPVNLSGQKRKITGKLGWQANFMLWNKSEGSSTSTLNAGYSYSYKVNYWNAHNDNRNQFFVPSVCWYFETRLHKHFKLQYRGAFSTIGHLQFGDYLLHSFYTKLGIRYSL